MSTVSLRRTSIRPEEIHASVDEGQVTLTLPGLSWAGSKPEFYALVGSVLNAVREAEDHQAVLNAMLPKGKK